jgi:uncharacterized glyoxalase superfamily protein PhnB
MPTNPDRKSHPTVTPCLSYRDAPAAIEWLCRAFGFEKHLVVPGEKPGTIVHSQLVFGHGMVMVSTSPDDDLDRRPWQRSPRQVGGNTACMCVLVEDVDGHARRAVAAGAEIIDPVADKSYGGRGYGCLDLEGHLWFFGSYDPWTPTP